MDKILRKCLENGIEVGIYDDMMGRKVVYRKGNRFRAFIFTKDELFSNISHAIVEKKMAKNMDLFLEELEKVKEKRIVMYFMSGNPFELEHEIHKMVEKLHISGVERVISNTHRREIETENVIIRFMPRHYPTEGYCPDQIFGAISGPIRDWFLIHRKTRDEIFCGDIYDYICEMEGVE